MKEEQFIKTNSNIWKDLEDLSSRINKKGVKAVSSSDIKKFLSCFRECSHHLAYARTHYAESSVVPYLNSLISKSHSQVYAVEKFSPMELLKYIGYEFPNLLKKYRYYVLASLGFFALGLVISMLLTLGNSNNAALFLQQSMVDSVKSGKTGSGGQWNYPLMSSTIMFNNISVSLRAFVFGITLGIGTIYVLFFNGATLGALAGLIYLYGDPKNFWSLILPHGVFELTAIFISGAAGLIIARSILIPGEYSRKHSLIAGAKKSVSLVMGVIIMLILAGIIEGFFTPLDISAGSKLIFAGLTAFILICYFSIPYVVKKNN